MAYKKDKAVTEESELVEAKRREEMGRLRELSDVKFIISSPEGRRFLRRMLESCFEYDTTIEHGTSNMIHARNEGRRTVMLGLKYDLSEMVIRKLVTADEVIPFLINLEEERDDS